MSLISRRDAGKLVGKLVLGSSAAMVLGSEALADGKRINSVIGGVQIGSQSYSFRDRPLAEALEGFRTVGLGECELSQAHLEPPKVSREELRQWRLRVPLSQFQEVRKQFENTGILLYAYNYSFRNNFTDPEIERGFQMAHALGVKYITASANVSVTPRVDRYAKKYKIKVGFHGHDNTSDPDEFSTPETFARAMQGASEYIAVNLDIGHFTAAGGDAVAYIHENHERIVTLHIKDRKKNHGPNMPFGQGDTPIAEVLRELRDNGWKIPANIEYEYGKPGMDTIEEMKKCYAYCRRALEA
jgi:sugar phosphate isomerase/epimerase